MKPATIQKLRIFACEDIIGHDRHGVPDVQLSAAKPQKDGEDRGKHVGLLDEIQK